MSSPTLRLIGGLCVWTIVQSPSTFAGEEASERMPSDAAVEWLRCDDDTAACDDAGWVACKEPGSGVKQKIYQSLERLGCAYRSRKVDLLRKLYIDFPAEIPPEIEEIMRAPEIDMDFDIMEMSGDRVVKIRYVQHYRITKPSISGLFDPHPPSDGGNAGWFAFPTAKTFIGGLFGSEKRLDEPGGPPETEERWIACRQEMAPERPDGPLRFRSPKGCKEQTLGREKPLVNVPTVCREKREGTDNAAGPRGIGDECDVNICRSVAAAALRVRSISASGCESLPP